MHALLRRLSQCLLLVASLASSPAAAVTIDWTFVGDPGNACDTQLQGCFGSVAYSYNIATYEVTNAQYAEFLNAVADTDPNALYNTSMGNPSPGSFGFGGITRTGRSGSYSYSAIAGRGDMPVNYVSFYDALRFANWLHNGQVTGAQDSTTTEDGAYTITAQGISDNSITRNPGATIFLTSEDQWYKAAYYNALSTSYFDYPAGSDSSTTCAVPGAGPNIANCQHAVGDLTDVGSYTGSASPYGTFDQGGNLFEWNEAIILGTRGVRGGTFYGQRDDTLNLAASTRRREFPTIEHWTIGFRVASIPEPGTGLLVMTGLLGLACRQKRRGSRRGATRRFPLRACDSPASGENL